MSMTVMQGYCWPLSAAPGETIEFRTSTGAANYTVTYLRFANASRDQVSAGTINASQELDAVALLDPVQVPGRLQNTGFTSERGCGSWTADFSLTVPDDWPSGIYAARCVDDAGSVFYITFIVKPAPGRRNRLAVLANTTTWNAYNNWGGFSRYEVDFADRVYQLSLLRPNPQATPVLIDEAPFNADILAKAPLFADPSPPGHYAHPVGMGIDRTSRHCARAEIWLLSWLEQAGYLVDVYTDLDLHRGIDGVASYRALVLSTHPEYWSVPMFTNLNQYLDLGGRLLYLGGNGLYDCVEYPTADLSTMVFSGTAGDRRWLFRSLVKPGTRPESSVLGVQYPGNQDESSREPYGVITSTHRFFRNTGLTGGSRFGQAGWNIPVGAASLAEGAASAFETDRMTPASPAGAVLLAAGANDQYPAYLVYYPHAGGGFVFSVGSITFGGSLVVDDTVQQVVRNVLDECLVAGNWPGLFGANLDAALAWGGGRFYFFQATQYIRYNATTDVADAEYPRLIAQRWPRLWDDGIDAALNWGNGKAYFFQGGEYIRYDIAAGTADDLYPKAIAGNWPGLWGEGIDAALDWAGDVVYFFKGSEYIRFEKSTGTAAAGYPKPIAENWPGLWSDGIDAAINWGNGKAYFFKGAEYIRYDLVGGPDPGYPLPIS